MVDLSTCHHDAVVVRQFFHAFDGLLVTTAGMLINNRLPSLTHPQEPKFYIFFIIIFLIGPRLIWFFRVFCRGTVPELFRGTALGLRWCWKQGKGTVVRSRCCV